MMEVKDFPFPCPFCGGKIGSSSSDIGVVTHSLPPCVEFTKSGEDSLDWLRKVRRELQIRGVIPMNAESFHDHLDHCVQCREQPFSLCEAGEKLLCSMEPT